jgi:hypothetical protein
MQNGGFMTNSTEFPKIFDCQDISFSRASPQALMIALYASARFPAAA